MAQTKVCSKCGREFPLNDRYFYSRVNKKTHFDESCRECYGDIFLPEAREGYKICIKCGKELLLTDEYFGKRKNSKDGFGNECKLCKKEYNKQLRMDNLEYYKERDRQYHATNKKTCNEKSRKYRADHKEEQVIKQKQYYQKNREAILAQKKQYGEKNKESIAKKRKEYQNLHKEEYLQKCKYYYMVNQESRLQQAKEYRENNKEIINAKQREYSKNHRTVFNIANQRRKARKKKLPSTLTLQQWQMIKDYFNNKCCYCGKELPLEQEHFTALSKGGAYTHNNIVPACKSCNISKHANNFFEWYPKQSFYSKKREKAILKFLGYYKQGAQQPALMI